VLPVTLQFLQKGFGQVLPATIAPSLENGKWYVSYVYVAGVRGTEKQMNSFLPPPEDANSKIFFLTPLACWQVYLLKQHRGMWKRCSCQNCWLSICAL